MSNKEWLQRNLTEVFVLPEPAVSWLLMVWDAIQVFDDVADGDPVERSDLDSVIWSTLVGIHQNPFFTQHAQTLVPLVATMILKWQGSDQAEREKQVNAKTYVWRAGYYDLVLATVNLVYGPAVAAKSAKMVMDLYGESFEDYLKEFE